MTPICPPSISAEFRRFHPLFFDHAWVAEKVDFSVHFQPVSRRLGPLQNVEISPDRSSSPQFALCGTQANSAPDCATLQRSRYLPRSLRPPPIQSITAATGCPFAPPQCDHLGARDPLFVGAYTATGIIRTEPNRQRSLNPLFIGAYTATDLTFPTGTPPRGPQSATFPTTTSKSALSVPICPTKRNLASQMPFCARRATICERSARQQRTRRIQNQPAEPPSDPPLASSLQACVLLASTVRQSSTPSGNYHVAHNPLLPGASGKPMVCLLQFGRAELHQATARLPAIPS